MSNIGGWPILCRHLEPVQTTLPLSRDALLELGLTGLQFGSGDRLSKDCLNVDVCPLTDGSVLSERGELYRVDGDKHFIQLNVCEPLPFMPATFDWAYSEHLIEHLTLPEGIAWMKHVRRVLAPGAVFRVTTPDLRRYVRAYMDDDEAFFQTHRDRLQQLGLPRMDDRKAFMINQIFQFWGHRWLYDQDELRHAMTRAGFDLGSFRMCSVGQGRVPAVAGLDTPLRDDETIYIEVDI